MLHTENGHMGMAPANAQEGVEVHVVLGCGQLRLLQPSAGKGSEVVGEC